MKLKNIQKYNDFGRCLICLKNPCQCPKCILCGSTTKVVTINKKDYCQKCIAFYARMKRELP